MQQLLEFLDGLPRERVGLILRSGELVEVQNCSAEPEKSFLVLADDILPHLDEMVGIFHTHPNGGLEPSPADIYGFRQWPELDHWIVAPEGVRCYRVGVNV